MSSYYYLLAVVQHNRHQYTQNMQPQITKKTSKICLLTALSFFI